MSRPWYEDPAALHELALWMEEHGTVSKGDLLELLEKPWHFQAEHDEMLRELMEQAA